MNVYIITCDDPIQTVPFLKKVIKAREEWITGVAITKGDRLTISKKRSVFLYLVTLLLIMGPLEFLKNSYISIYNKLLKIFSIESEKTFEGWLKKENIPVKRLSSPNDKDFLDFLERQDIDIIIHQSPFLMKKDLLEVPNIGTLNRHNALLPKNRGRLTPFWVLYKGENETGVTIHFAEEDLDAGDIIVQKRIPVTDRDSFNDLVKKNYEVAPEAMIEALDKLNNGYNKFIPNNDEEATYNTTPTVSDALKFRFNQIIQKLNSFFLF